MKLLFDENMSPKLVFRLADVFPNSVHVDRVGLGAKIDDDVWEYASQYGYTIVSKDSDFHERSILKGYPPKVIWLRRGNCSSRQIEMILRGHAEDIKQFSINNDLAFLILL